MKKLLEFLAHNSHVQKQDGEFGIEIEVEGARLPVFDDKYWKTVRDGSLRDGGQEYVLQAPVKLKAVPLVLKQLTKKFEENNSELSFSFRTSVHIHMNVQDIEFNHALNLIYTYLLLEEPLMNFCGESRKANRFCLRLADAEGLLDTLHLLFSRGEAGLLRMPADRSRYAAINVEALIKYGSIEFRAMQGNMDVERITTWCTTLGRLKEFACKFESPADIYNKFAEVEAEEFFKLVLGDLAPIFQCPSLVKDIQRNFSLSIDLPFAYLEYKNKEVAKEKKGVKLAGKVADVMVIDEMERIARALDLEAAVAHVGAAAPIRWEEMMRPDPRPVVRADELFNQFIVVPAKKAR